MFNFNERLDIPIIMVIYSVITSTMIYLCNSTYVPLASAFNRAMSQDLIVKYGLHGHPLLKILKSLGFLYSSV